MRFYRLSRCSDSAVTTALTPCHQVVTYLWPSPAGGLGAAAKAVSEHTVHQCSNCQGPFVCVTTHKRWLWVWLVSRTCVVSNCCIVGVPRAALLGR
jgi:hypothetical protein